MIDVLRASTTICAALAAGAEAIIPVAELEEALRLAAGSASSPLRSNRFHCRICQFICYG